jgi:hypothetical protein
MRFAQGCWARDVVLIGTRLLNLSVADNDHPEPMVQDIGPGGTGGDEFGVDRVVAQRARCGHALDGVSRPLPGLPRQARSGTCIESDGVTGAVAFFSPWPPRKTTG